MYTSAILLLLLLADNTEKASAKRGYEAITTQAFVPGIWARTAYDSAWKRWGVAEKPKDFESEFRNRYGLHPAPYPNDNLPMGMREGINPFGLGKGLTLDCMICHGGSIGGQSYIGLGNTSLDLDSLFTELSGLSKEGTKSVLFPFTNVRGTTEAAAMSVFLFSIRNTDLSIRTVPQDFKLRSDLCEDTPPWWHMKKKHRLYYNASVDARSVRTLMQFTMSPVYSLKTIAERESTFRDIQAYLKTIESPKYPLAIRTELASRGEAIFKRDCARCHGTYGPNGTFPNKLIDVEEVGTDPSRAEGISNLAKLHYDKTWFAEEKDEKGNRFNTSNDRVYIAPPLDGIWATAPYFHNGSVPTLEGVLNSKSRPVKFTRSYRTDFSEYDSVRVGWKVKELPVSEPAPSKPWQKRFIYDTQMPGRKNTGHTFGDHLSDEDRLALIEYLKTL